VKLSFLPGKLFLEAKPDGAYELRFGEEIQTFRSRKQAVQAFNDLRTRLEKEFPARELTPEERRALLLKDIADSAISHNSMRNTGPRKKTGSRRFG
jgi:hypothetical protein